MKVLNSMARTKDEPVDPWADNSFKNQTKVSCKEHTHRLSYFYYLRALKPMLGYVLPQYSVYVYLVEVINFSY